MVILELFLQNWVFHTKMPTWIFLCLTIYRETCLWKQITFFNLGVFLTTSLPCSCYILFYRLFSLIGVQLFSSLSKWRTYSPLKHGALTTVGKCSTACCQQQDWGIRYSTLAIIRDVYLCEWNPIIRKMTFHMCLVGDLVNKRDLNKRLSFSANQEWKLCTSQSHVVFKSLRRRSNFAIVNMRQESTNVSTQ
jgi:hypothetical protein